MFKSSKTTPEPQPLLARNKEKPRMALETAPLKDENFHSMLSTEPESILHRNVGKNGSD